MKFNEFYFNNNKNILKLQMLKLKIFLAKKKNQQVVQFLQKINVLGFKCYSLVLLIMYIQKYEHLILNEISIIDLTFSYNQISINI